MNAYRDQVRHGNRSALPGAVRVSAGINTTGDEVLRLLDAVARLCTEGPLVPYHQDPATGDFLPR